VTLQGWDASHYDGPLSRAILARAYAEGIRFFTHKIAEGLQDTEGSLDDTALAAARDVGMPFVGGYFVARTNATPAAQVGRWVQLADAGEGWWRAFPGWFWQVDLERWSYDNVPASVGIDCARRLRDATGRAVILYASRGQYGDQLTGWDGPLWNADYRGGPGYPGDGWVAADKGAPAGWAPYSGKVPAILQYTSSATIAGLTTCDANAFRGSVADFAAMIGGKTVALLDDPQKSWLEWMAYRVEAESLGLDVVRDGPGKGEPMWLVQTVRDIQTKVSTPAPVALTDADRAAIIAGVAAEIGGKLDELLARLAAAGDALNG
jgi:hypothetical protein